MNLKRRPFLNLGLKRVEIIERLFLYFFSSAWELSWWWPGASWSCSQSGSINREFAQKTLRRSRYHVTENRELSWWQLCRHWWYHRLSFWQPPAPPVMTKLILWLLLWDKSCLNLARPEFESWVRTLESLEPIPLHSSISQLVYITLFIFP